MVPGNCLIWTGVRDIYIYIIIITSLSHSMPLLLVTFPFYSYHVQLNTTNQQKPSFSPWFSKPKNHEPNPWFALKRALLQVRIWCLGALGMGLSLDRVNRCRTEKWLNSRVSGRYNELVFMGFISWFISQLITMGPHPIAFWGLWTNPL